MLFRFDWFASREIKDTAIVSVQRVAAAMRPQLSRLAVRCDTFEADAGAVRELQLHLHQPAWSSNRPVLPASTIH